jgi:hypothetical protein
LEGGAVFVFNKPFCADELARCLHKPLEIADSTAVTGPIVTTKGRGFMRLLKHIDVEIHSLEGTIEWVNYRTRELRVIADGRPWNLALSDGCRLWFNGRIAPFAFFQPLDSVRIFCEECTSGFIAQALYLWVEASVLSLSQQDGAFHEMDVC